MTAALAQGRHVAGWLGYELGYALEPRLRPPAPGPLLRLGVFEAPPARCAGARRPRLCRAAQPRMGRGGLCSALCAG